MQDGLHIRKNERETGFRKINGLFGEGMRSIRRNGYARQRKTRIFTLMKPKRSRAIANPSLKGKPIQKLVATSVAIAFAFGLNSASAAEGMQFCALSNPKEPDSAFEQIRSKPTKTGDYWVRYSCTTPCDDWQECLAPSFTQSGRPLMQGDRPKQALAFVVDGMGGHLSFTDPRARDATILFHSGMGGTSFWPNAKALEDRADLGTVMIRWERGFVDRGVRGMFSPAWGWYTRTSSEPARVPELNKRVATVISWVHDNIAGTGMFGTAGCSMGAQATFGAVYWNELDSIIDYQFFMGGPPLWDINSLCGRRKHETGYCDADGTTACSRDADCEVAGPYARCLFREPITYSPLLESVVNHVHGSGDQCRPDTADETTRPYRPFDESSIGYTDGDREFDHPFDFQLDFHRSDTSSAIGMDGDEDWAGGQFMHVFNAIESTRWKRWIATYNSAHCASWYNGNAVGMIIEGMGLE